MFDSRGDLQLSAMRERCGDTNFWSVIDTASDIDWQNADAIDNKLAALRALLNLVDEYSPHVSDVHLAIRVIYASQMREAFVSPCKFFLERRLVVLSREIPGHLEHCSTYRQALKLYMRLTGPELGRNRNSSENITDFAVIWAELNPTAPSASNKRQFDLGTQMEPLVKAYFELPANLRRRKGRVIWLEPNTKVLELASDVLTNCPDVPDP